MAIRPTVHVWLLRWTWKSIRYSQNFTSRNKTKTLMSKAPINIWIRNIYSSICYFRNSLTVNLFLMKNNYGNYIYIHNLEAKRIDKIERKNVWNIWNVYVIEFIIVELFKLFIAFHRQSGFFVWFLFSELTFERMQCGAVWRVFGNFGDIDQKFRVACFEVRSIMMA